MRTLTEATLVQRRLVRLAVEDYFGVPIHEHLQKRLVLALRGDHVALTLEEKDILERVKTNLGDPVYAASLLCGEASFSSPLF